MFWVLVTLFSHVALHFVKRNTFNFYYIIFSKNYLCIHFKNSLQNSHVPDRVILWQIHFAKWKFLKMPQTAIICQLVANSGCVVWGHINTCNCTCNFVYSKLVNCNWDLICPESTFALPCSYCWAHYLHLPFGLSGWETSSCRTGKKIFASDQKHVALYANYTDQSDKSKVIKKEVENLALFWLCLLTPEN